MGSRRSSQLKDLETLLDLLLAINLRVTVSGEDGWFCNSRHCGCDDEFIDCWIGLLID